MQKAFITAVFLLVLALPVLSFAGPVIFDVETNLENDTLYLGVPGSIMFTVDANGNSVAAVTYSFELEFSDGNSIGEMYWNWRWLDSSQHVSISEACRDVFESVNWSSFYGQGNDPDTVLFGMYSIGRSEWTGSGEVWRVDFIPTSIGTIRFDTIFLPPANTLQATSDAAEELPILWLGDGLEITVAIPWPGDVNSNGDVNSSDIIHLVNYVFKGGPAPIPPTLGDVNASCAVTSSDIVYLVSYVFKGGTSPLVGCE